MTTRRGRAAEPSDHAAAHERLEERITERVELSIQAIADRQEASNLAVREILKQIQADVRRGQFDRDDMKNRLRELENAVGENRDAGRLLRDKIDAIEAGHRVDAETIVEAAPAAAALAAKKAPAELWSSLARWQKIVAITGGLTAVLAGCSGALTGLERLAKAGWYGAATAWTHAKADDDRKAD